MVPDTSDELAGLGLGDARLNRRASRIAQLLAARPDDSFPDQTGDAAELEALYRFLSNARVDPETLLGPHMQLTAARAAGAGSVIVIHDTTVFSFGGESKREGLGRLKKAGQGFSAHVALVVEPEHGVPLGVIGVIPTVRLEPLQPRAETRAKVHDRVREFARWNELLEHCVERLGDSFPIHVMDREGDAYSIFAQLVEHGQSFVIRSKTDRALDVAPRNDRTPRTLRAALTRAPFVMNCEVQLSTKRPDRMARLRKVKARMSRTAALRVSATRVDLRHPTYTAGKSRKGSPLPRSIGVNVVHVEEVNPPPDQTAVEWVLYTTLPVATEDEVAAVIDAYRRRWLIEEYFKALKTGCSFEKRQLESKHALLNALALFVPIAWRLLTLRYLARVDPDMDAAMVLTERQLAILRARKKRPLSVQPTVEEAVAAIAAEGGHIKNNGDPGWLVLSRGYEKLLLMEAGYVLGQAAK